MYNHTVTRLAYLPIFSILFVGGICAGSLLGLFVFLMDRSFVNFLCSAFIALLSGVLSGLMGLLYTAVFNLLAPAIGGIPIKVEDPPVPAKDSFHI